MSAQAASAEATKKVQAVVSWLIWQYTTLFAGDDEDNREHNHKFIVQRGVATSVSRTIKDMFDGTPLTTLG
jgi:hypothetical protein